MFLGVYFYPEGLYRYHTMLATENLKAEPVSVNFGAWHLTRKIGALEGY